MNFNLLLIYLSVCATIGAFRPKRDQFFKFHGHQIFKNPDYTNDQDPLGTLKRTEQLKRLIANIEVSFGRSVGLVDLINYVLITRQTECFDECYNNNKCNNKAKTKAGFQTFSAKTSDSNFEKATFCKKSFENYFKNDALQH